MQLTSKRPVLYMYNGKTNGKAHVYSDKQIHLDMDTIDSYKSGISVGEWSDLRFASCVLSELRDLSTYILLISQFQWCDCASQLSPFHISASSTRTNKTFQTKNQILKSISITVFIKLCSSQYNLTPEFHYIITVQQVSVHLFWPLGFDSSWTLILGKSLGYKTSLSRSRSNRSSCCTEYLIFG